MAMNGPLWKMFRSGTNKSVVWKDYPSNPRFAIYDSKNDSNAANPATFSDDLVLDKETGLVWTRDANLLGQHNWLDANTLCREVELGNRSGWRLPAVEELSSLVDPSQPNLALPAGHPFMNVQFGSGDPAYWSSTNSENPTAAAWFVNFWRGAGPHLAGLGNKSIPGFVWPVRGGAGGNSWNW
jgi:Protein of unknown function (DUF1566)